MSHPELAGRMIAGKDWVDNDDNPTDPGTEGHGTHTTGTMAGLHVGVAGVAGAASNVKVYVQRVCGPNGCPTSAIVNAINAAADYKDAGGNYMVAMNLSLGGLFISRAEKDAIARATSRGILVIASAGNDGTNRVSCPACDSNAISVAATSWMDKRSYYSNWGSGLDISAPGGEMYSNTTEEIGILSSVPGNYTAGPTAAGPIASAKYAYYQGTSMAAPQVTGVAAIVASKTGARGAALRSRLESTADNLGPAGYDTDFGNGRINAYRAVTQTTLNEGSGGGTPTDNPPTATFTKSCSGLTCTFTSTGTDDNGISARSWSFSADNSTATGTAVTKTFAKSSTSNVTHTTTDTANQSTSSTQTVTCNKRSCS
jgi:serine protease